MAFLQWLTGYLDKTNGDKRVDLLACPLVTTIECAAEFETLGKHARAPHDLEIGRAANCNARLAMELKRGAGIRGDKGRKPLAQLLARAVGAAAACVRADRVDALGDPRAHDRSLQL